eukprot:scaffold33950_cov29-Tisochrysis_lutea.AAC.6
MTETSICYPILPRRTSLSTLTGEDEAVRYGMDRQLGTGRHRQPYVITHTCAIFHASRPPAFCCRSVRANQNT